MADEELKVLFVEDSPEDVALEERALKSGGLIVKSLRVETPEDLVHALKEFKPDLILSDYSLPRMDGLAALKIARELSPEVPLIYVSGTIGEERAIESLKSGATDYVVKDKLGGLAIKVRRALAEARERLERRRAEDQLRQSQKMEAVGRLAGGVAHDFNNLLTAITGYTELVRARLESDNSSRQDLDEVLKASARAASLTRQLLAFSRKQILQPRVVDLNAIVSDMDRMLQRLLSENIGLVSSLQAGLGGVKADPGQVEQIILNLVLNARDAMNAGGKLTIETSSIALDETFALQHPGVIPGPHVMLAVTDTGTGMTEEVKAHLFEPFFTTKDPGKGTGLGLSTVYGIVKQSLGTISVYSELGHGTTFKVLFPRVDEPVDPKISKHTISGTMHGFETILLVEDAEPVRHLVKAVLGKKGYTILEASDGKSALDRCAESKEPIHLLLTDMVMPRMSGRELAQSLISLHPQLKVLFMSGYAEDAVVQNGHWDRGTPFLSKPFTSAELARKVREVLDSSI